MIATKKDSHQRSYHPSRHLTSELKPCPDTRIEASTLMINLWCRPWDSRTGSFKIYVHSFAIAALAHCGSLQVWLHFGVFGSWEKTAAAGVFGHLQSRSVSSSWTLLHGGRGTALKCKQPVWSSFAIICLPVQEVALGVSQQRFREKPKTYKDPSIISNSQQSERILGQDCHESWVGGFQIPLSGEFTQWLSQHYRRLLVGGGNFDFFRTDPRPPWRRALSQGWTRLNVNARYMAVASWRYVYKTHGELLHIVSWMILAVLWCTSHWLIGLPGLPDAARSTACANCRTCSFLQSFSPDTTLPISQRCCCAGYGDLYPKTVQGKCVGVGLESAS